jgi:hypothetical protein
MPAQVDTRIAPLEVRWLLALAGVLLPPSLRSDWLREWHSEFWHDCATSNGRASSIRAIGAFPDAWFLLRQDYGLLKRLRDLWQARPTPSVMLVLLIGAFTTATRGLERGRDLLFNDNSERVIVVAQRGPFMGVSARVPAAQAAAWLKQAATISELGRWSVESRVIDGRRVRICAAAPAARDLLAASSVPLTCDQIEAAPSNLPSFGGLIARLKDGRSVDDAERELAQTAGLHKNWRAPEVVSLVTLRRTPVKWAGWLLLGLMVLAALSMRAVTVQAAAWSASKIVLSFALIFEVWIELAARAPLTETASFPAAWSALLYLLPVVAGGLAACWLRHDRDHRCEVCHRALILPVFVEPGRSLLEPSGTAYLCAAGHGALLAGLDAGHTEGAMWTTWSSSQA